MTGAEVRRQLGRVVGWRGAPTRLRSDNGSEFICEALAGGVAVAGTKGIPVAPASAGGEGFIQSFHSPLRDQIFDREGVGVGDEAPREAEGGRPGGNKP